MHQALLQSNASFPPLAASRPYWQDRYSNWRQRWNVRFLPLSHPLFTRLKTNPIPSSGKITALNLLQKNATVYIASRDLTKASAAIAEIKTNHPTANAYALQLDLSSFASVKRAVEIFQATESELHILVNNAGAVGLPLELAADGYDLLWTVRRPKQ